MHNPQAQGDEFFVCDFCRRHWADDRPMVEGHRGALICAKCLTLAYTDLVYSGQGTALSGTLCTMCLENRAQPQWCSPLHPEAHACLRCVRQAAGVLSRDPDYGWQRPPAPAGTQATSQEAHEEQDEE